ncbi:hypothetical protein BJ546DRAFT_127211 [Cryomyces antarcticus]
MRRAALFALPLARLAASQSTIRLLFPQNPAQGDLVLPSPLSASLQGSNPTATTLVFACDQKNTTSCDWDPDGWTVTAGPTRINWVLAGSIYYDYTLVSSTVYKGQVSYGGDGQGQLPMTLTDSAVAHDVTITTGDATGFVTIQTSPPIPATSSSLAVSTGGMSQSLASTKSGSMAGASTGSMSTTVAPSSSTPNTVVVITTAAPRTTAALTTASSQASTVSPTSTPTVTSKTSAATAASSATASSATSTAGAARTRTASRSGCTGIGRVAGALALAAAVMTGVL